jgi:hypothetical protein
LDTRGYLRETKGGTKVHGPPYTKAEIDDFYRGNGSIAAVYRGARTAPKSPKLQRRPHPVIPLSAPAPGRFAMLARDPLRS